MKSTKRCVLLLVVAVSLLATQCGPTPEPRVIEETVLVEATPQIVEKEVTKVVEEKVTVEVEKVVEKPTEEKVLRINTGPGIQAHISPLYYLGTGSVIHSYPWVFLPLTFYAPDGHQEPMLAESWEVTPDAMEWTFYLRENATWTDGEPITAEDVKWSYEQFCNPERTKYVIGISIMPLPTVVGYDAYVNGEADEIEGIEIVDEHTVRFHMSFPNPIFVDNDGWRLVIPKHVWGDVDYATLDKDPRIDGPQVSSGPFKLVTWEFKQYIELEKWDDYWGPKKPKVDRVILVQSRGEPALNLLEVAQLDHMTYVSQDMVDRINAIANVKLINQLTFGILTIQVNQRVKYMQDVRVRQAMAYAIDRKAYSDLLWGGQGEAIQTEIGPDWALSPNLIEYKYDPDKARELLAEAEWDPDQVVRYWSALPEGTEDKAALLFQSAFADVGMKMEIVHIPFASVIDVLEVGDYDLRESGGGACLMYPHMCVQDEACATQWSRYKGWCSERLDELDRLEMATTDMAERQKYAWEEGEILNRELPEIWLIREPMYYAINNRLLNYEPANWNRYATAGLLDWDLADGE